MRVLSQDQTDRQIDMQTDTQMGKEANKKKHEQPQNRADFSFLEERPVVSSLNN